MKNKNDDFFMRRALELAERGSGWVAPNPLVGAVIVKNNKIIGEGYHARYGEIHAEVAALKNTASRGELVLGATLYCTLEPCNHVGKQPPCTQAILDSKIARVVYAAPDPNPNVLGNGGQKLRSFGLTVDEKVLEAEARRQNKIYFHWVATKKPYTLVKVAISHNNKLTSRVGTRTNISGPEAWELTQSLRQHYDAVMIGAGTVIIDNPTLTVRSKKIQCPRDPRRVIIDGQLTIPPTAKIFEKSNNLIITSGIAPANKIIPLRTKTQIAVLAETDKNISAQKIIDELARQNITSVLIEGGAELLQLFFESDLANEWIIMRSPKIFNEGVDFIKEPEKFTQKFSLRHETPAGDDIIEYYLPC